MNGVNSEQEKFNAALKVALNTPRTYTLTFDKLDTPQKIPRASGKALLLKHIDTLIDARLFYLLLEITEDFEINGETKTIVVASYQYHLTLNDFQKQVQGCDIPLTNVNPVSIKKNQTAKISLRFQRSVPADFTKAYLSYSFVYY